MREWVGRVKHNLHIFEPVLPPPISSEFKTENFSSIFFKISRPLFFSKERKIFRFENSALPNAEATGENHKSGFC